MEKLPKIKQGNSILGLHIFITFVKIYAFWWRGTPRKRHSNCEQKEKPKRYEDSKIDV